MKKTVFLLTTTFFTTFSQFSSYGTDVMPLGNYDGLFRGHADYYHEVHDPRLGGALQGVAQRASTTEISQDEAKRFAAMACAVTAQTALQAAALNVFIQNLSKIMIQSEETKKAIDHLQQQEQIARQREEALIKEHKMLEQKRLEQEAQKERERLRLEEAQQRSGNLEATQGNNIEEVDEAARLIEEERAKNERLEQERLAAQERLDQQQRRLNVRQNMIQLARQAAELGMDVVQFQALLNQGRTFEELKREKEARETVARLERERLERQQREAQQRAQEAERLERERLERQQREAQQRAQEAQNRAWLRAHPGDTIPNLPPLFNIDALSGAQLQNRIDEQVRLARQYLTLNIAVVNALGIRNIQGLDKDNVCTAFVRVKAEVDRIEIEREAELQRQQREAAQERARFAGDSDVRILQSLMNVDIAEILRQFPNPFDRENEVEIRLTLQQDGVTTRADYDQMDPTTQFMLRDAFNAQDLRLQAIGALPPVQPIVAPAVVVVNFSDADLERLRTAQYLRATVETSNQLARSIHAFEGVIRDQVANVARNLLIREMQKITTPKKQRQDLIANSDVFSDQIRHLLILELADSGQIITAANLMNLNLAEKKQRLKTQRTVDEVLALPDLEAQIRQKYNALRQDVLRERERQQVELEAAILQDEENIFIKQNKVHIEGIISDPVLLILKKDIQRTMWLPNFQGTQVYQDLCVQRVDHGSYRFIQTRNQDPILRKLQNWITSLENPLDDNGVLVADIKAAAQRSLNAILGVMSDNEHIISFFQRLYVIMPWLESKGGEDLRNNDFARDWLLRSFVDAGMAYDGRNGAQDGVSCVPGIIERMTLGLKEIEPALLDTVLKSGDKKTAFRDNLNNTGAQFVRNLLPDNIVGGIEGAKREYIRIYQEALKNLCTAGIVKVISDELIRNGLPAGEFGDGKFQQQWGFDGQRLYLDHFRLYGGDPNYGGRSDYYLLKWATFQKEWIKINAKVVDWEEVLQLRVNDRKRFNASGILESF